MLTIRMHLMRTAALVDDYVYIVYVETGLKAQFSLETRIDPTKSRLCIGTAQLLS